MTWDGCSSPRQLDSTFFHLLKESTWIPSVDTTLSRETTATNQHREVHNNVLKKPAEVYMKDKLIMQLLAFHVSYLQPDIKTPTCFLSDIRVKMNLSLEELVEKLKNWALLIEEGHPFCTTLRHMKSVYKYLSDHLDDFRQLFIETALVFIPSGSLNVRESGHDSIIRGHFHRLSELCWHDSTELFKDYQPSFIVEKTGETYKRLELKPFYPDMKDLFLGILGVSLSPNMNEYVMLLSQICQEANLPDKSAVRNALKIYAVLGEKCISTKPDKYV